MREIKFRSWLKDEKSMNYNFTILNHPQMSEDEEHILMQYTGVRDKNGNEIYEGDILETKHKMKGGSWVLRYKVFFDEKGYWNAESLDKEKPYKMCYAGFEKAEVIGNIYENPGLLEVNDE